jgi:hypothetical protein
MTPKIVGHRIEANSNSADDLRRMFNTAVCQLHQANQAVKKTLQYGTPIFQRRNIVNVSQEGQDKRAVSEAARALAQLWKISGTPAR